MLILALTTDKLEIVTGQAVTVDTVATFSEIDSSTLAFKGSGKELHAVTTATTTDLVGVPGATTTRNVKSINICNKHASASVDVTVQFNANGTTYRLFFVTLRAGDVLQYSEQLGWYVVSATVAQMIRMFKLGSDVTNSTTTAAKVGGWNRTPTTGLGSFMFYYDVIHQAGATTTGIKFSVNHTGTVSQFVYWVEETTANPLQADGVQDQDVILATGGLNYVNAARAKSTAGLGSSVSVDTANADMLTVIRGICTVTADGELELWSGSEVAAATTVKAGSGLMLALCD
jgi:hypothetical protein